MFWVRSLPSARKVKCSFFCSLTSLLEMPQYYHTALSDHKIAIQQNKIHKKKQSFLHFYTITFIDVFIIILPISCYLVALLQNHLFFVQLNATQAQVEQWITKAYTRRKYAYLCEYVDICRLMRAHGTSIWCPVIFELHCVDQNISLLPMST